MKQKAREEAARVPGWPEYLEGLKASGRWNGDDPAVRERLTAEWRALAEEQAARDEAPVIADLAAAGVEVGSVWDYVNGRALPPEALPVLLRHLEEPHPVSVREGIARAIAEPAARFAWDRLRTLYASLDAIAEKRLKDALAVTLAACASAEDLDQVAALARDRANGASRVLLLGYFRRHRGPRTVAVLEDLTRDEEVRPEAEHLLKTLSRGRGRRPR